MDRLIGFEREASVRSQSGMSISSAGYKVLLSNFSAVDLFDHLVVAAYCFPHSHDYEAARLRFVTFMAGGFEALYKSKKGPPDEQA